MPRKKKEEATPEAVVPQTQDSPASEPKRRTSATRTALFQAAPKPEPSAQPTPDVEAPKPVVRRRRPKAEVKPEEPAKEAAVAPAVVEATETPVVKRRRRASAPKAEAETAEMEPATKEAPSRRRRRTAAKPKVEAEPTTEPQPKIDEAEPQPKVKEAVPSRSRRRRAPRPEPTVVAEAAQAPEPATAGAEEPGLPVPIWRKPARAAAEEPTSSPEPEAEPQLAPRRARTRKRRDRKEIEITAAAALAPEPAEAEAKPAQQTEPAQKQPKPREQRPRRERQKRVEETPRTEAQPAPKAEEKPRPEPRPTIPVPEDAPRVVLRDGVPTLVRDKRIYPPVFFFASALDEARLATVLEQVRMAADNGIHVFSLLVELLVAPAAVDDAVSFAGYLVKQVAGADPQAQIILRTVFTATDGWDRKYPNAKYVSQSGGLAEPSVCDKEFWGVAEQCLTDFIKKVRLVDPDNRIMGVHLERGEWFQAEGAGYDRSVAAHEAFRNWLRLRYRDDAVSLRAAWYDGSAQFDTVAVPEFRTGASVPEDFVRTGRKTRRWVDYHLFLSDATVNRIASLAYAVKAASEGRMLVGVSYGYTFEWSHPASGHLSLGKLLRCHELDYIAGPPSYKNREPGGSAPFPGPIDSFALNGKLYISEEDFKTPISGRQEPDDFNPVMRTPQALESVHWRGAGSALAHAGGVCWMDSWGNGWLNSAGIWARAKALRDAMTWRMDRPQTPPDVAMFIDERSLAYLADQRAFRMLVQEVREAMLRSGLSVGFYLLSDLAHRERFPESRLYVFVNAWDIRPEVRSAIKTRLQRDDKVLFWLYSAGLFEAGREALERVREVTGIALRPQPFSSKPGTTLTHQRHPLCEALPERTLASGSRLEPSYFAIPEEGFVLGEYSQTGLPSFVVRPFEAEGDREHRWTSVFLGEPVVTPALFRALGQMAGAHVWNFHSDVVHVRPPFLTVHCTGAGQRTLTLPNKWSAYNLVANEWAVVDANSLRFNALDGATYTFLVGNKTELESILASRPSEHLTMDSIPPQAENIQRWDQAQFDVPIMKLDEWVEESWSEDLADDLLIKRSVYEAEVEEPPVPEVDRSGRRRKRHRNRPGSDESGPEESSSARREGADAEGAGDAGVNVMFRRRE